LFLHYSIRTEKGLLLDPKVSSIPSDASSNPFWACHRSIVVRSGKGGKDRPLTPPKTLAEPLHDQCRTGYGRVGRCAPFSIPAWAGSAGPHPLGKRPGCSQAKSLSSSCASR